MPGRPELLAVALFRFSDSGQLFIYANGVEPP